MELSAYVLEIPYDGYTTLSQSLIGCSTLSQYFLQAERLILENNEKTTLNINMLNLSNLLRVGCGVDAYIGPPLLI